jgi:hypothetical protein
MSKILASHILQENFATKKVTSLKLEANSVELSAFLPQRNKVLVKQELSSEIKATSKNVMDFANSHKTKGKTSFPKRPDTMGAPDKVFKFNNILDRLIGGIKANTISAIGAINLGSLCTQYLYAPQIHFNLAREPIAFIGNLSNKMGEFV